MHRRMTARAATGVRTRLIAGLALTLSFPALAAETLGATTAVTCTNRTSGASWQIAIDPAKHTVDSNPAEFTPAAITWFDPKDGGNYTLDRRSGDLTASVASSTGGYFRHGRCSLEKAR